MSTVAEHTATLKAFKRWQMTSVEIAGIYQKKESANSTMWGIARMLTRGASFSTQKNLVQPTNVIIKSVLKDTQRIANFSRLENVVNMVQSVNLNMKIRSKIMAKKKKTLMLKRKFMKNHVQPKNVIKKLA